MDTDKIKWTSDLNRGAGTGGDTEYAGAFEGEGLFVIRGTLDDRGRRVFRAYRNTGDGTEHPVGDGGERRKMWHAREDCERELATEIEAGTAAGYVRDLRERRDLLHYARGAGLGREAHRMTLVELRELKRANEAQFATTDEITAAGAVTLRPSRDEDTPPRGLLATAAARTGALGSARLVGESDHVPLTRTVDEIDTGEIVWRVGDRVAFDGPVHEQGDVWRIETIYVPEAPRGPYAGLRLVQRAGGLGYGETRTALGLEQLRRHRVSPVAPTPDDPQYEIDKLRSANELCGRSRQRWLLRAGALQQRVDELTDEVAGLRRQLAEARGERPVAEPWASMVPSPHPRANCGPLNIPLDEGEACPTCGTRVP